MWPNGGEEVLAFEREHMRGGAGRHRRRARDVVQEGDLAEVVTRPERARLGARDLHPQLPVGDDVEAVADLADADDRGGRLDGHRLEPRHEALQRRLRQRREERDAPQELQLAARRRREPHQPRPGRERDGRKDQARDDERAAVSHQLDEHGNGRRADADRRHPQGLDESEDSGLHAFRCGPLQQRQERRVEDDVPHAEHREQRDRHHRPARRREQRDGQAPDERADLCAERGLWLHVDGAYGGFATLTERGRRALAGIERADSVTLDPHKWLYQPFEAGCLLVREREALLRSFRVLPDYLRDAEVTGDREVNFSDLGIQLTRSARALKIWVSLQYFGVDAFRAAIDRCLDLALLAATAVEGEPELELLSPPTLGVLCFRRRPPDVDDEGELARVNSAIVARMAASGEGMISSTRLGGRYALRLCVLNHSSGPEDVLGALRFAAESPANGDVEAHAAAWQDAELARFAAYDRNLDAGSV